MKHKEAVKMIIKDRLEREKEIILSEPEYFKSLIKVTGFLITDLTHLDVKNPEKPEVVSFFDNPDFFVNRIMDAANSFIDDNNFIGFFVLVVHKSAMMSILHLLLPVLTPKERGEIFNVAWQQAEFPSLVSKEEKDMISSIVDKTPKEFLMSSKEMERFNSLPEEFKVYRGVINENCLNGFSWTLDYEIAKKFAGRFRDGSSTSEIFLAINSLQPLNKNEINPIVASIEINKDDVSAFFEREEEAFIDVTAIDINQKNLKIEYV